MKNFILLLSFILISNPSFSSPPQLLYQAGKVEMLKKQEYISLNGPQKLKDETTLKTGKRGLAIVVHDMFSLKILLDSEINIRTTKGGNLRLKLIKGGVIVNLHAKAGKANIDRVKLRSDKFSLSSKKGLFMVYSDKSGNPHVFVNFGEVAFSPLNSKKSTTVIKGYQARILPPNKVETTVIKDWAAKINWSFDQRGPVFQTPLFYKNVGIHP